MERGGDRSASESSGGEIIQEVIIGHYCFLMLLGIRIHRSGGVETELVDTELVGTKCAKPLMNEPGIPTGQVCLESRLNRGGIKGNKFGKFGNELLGNVDDIPVTERDICGGDPFSIPFILVHR